MSSTKGFDLKSCRVMIVETEVPGGNREVPDLLGLAINCGFTIAGCTSVHMQLPSAQRSAMVHTWTLMRLPTAYPLNDGRAIELARAISAVQELQSCLNVHLG
jgi:hypothetical protein